MESVQRAMLLDRVRKSMSLLDRPRYFASLGEVLTVSFPDSYWPHSEFTLDRCERIRRGPRAPRTACLALAQIDPFGTVREPASATAGAKMETE